MKKFFYVFLIVVGIYLAGWEAPEYVSAPSDYLVATGLLLVVSGLFLIFKGVTGVFKIYKRRSSK